MHAATTWLAPAKLNLDLRITGRRSDGYHLLQTVFTLIDWYDTISLQVRSDGVIHLHNPVDGDMHTDLAWRAANALQQHTGGKLGADIWLDKRIPTGAGLGGGSSDAACVLLALNKLWHTDVPQHDLLMLGLGLGADVPFFIFGRSAWAQGVGEQLQPLKLPRRWYVIIKPDVHVCTATVFASQDLTHTPHSSRISLSELEESFHNDMQDAVLNAYPAVRSAFERMCAYGTPMVTGSGACVFLRFSSMQAAWQTYRCLVRQEGSNVYMATGIDVHPFWSTAFGESSSG